MANLLPSLELLFRLPRVAARPGTSDAEIDTAEQARRVWFPAELRELYRRCNGIELAPRLRIYPLAEAVAMSAAVSAAQDGLNTFGLFALTDNEDSNPVCVACDSPLTGYVIQLYHDNDPRVICRSLEEFLAALAPFLATGEAFLEDMPSAFAGPARTDEDRRIGRELIALAANSDSTAGYDYAVILLDSVPELARLLDHDNEDVRRAAERRLNGIGSPVAVGAVRVYREEFSRFAERIAATLRVAGLNANLCRIHDEPQVRVEDGPIWLNLPVFYPLRREADGFDRIVRRVRELVEANRNPSP